MTPFEQASFFIFGVKLEPVNWNNLEGGKYYHGRKYSGPFIKYYNDGDIELEGIFVDGHRKGEWRFYYHHKILKNVKVYK